MKKMKLFILSFVALATIAFVSCEDQKVSPVFEDGSAMITGTALVNLDATNDTSGTLYEYVPEGVVITAIYNTMDLVTYPFDSATYQDAFIKKDSNYVNVFLEMDDSYSNAYIQTTVGAEGAFSFEIPANTKMVNVTLTGDDFKASYTAADTTITQEIFASNWDEYSVYKGNSKIIELVFGMGKE